MLNFEQKLINIANRFNKKKEYQKIKMVKKHMKEAAKKGYKKTEIYDFFGNGISESEISFFDLNFSHIKVEEKEWELGYYYILDWSGKVWC